MPSDIGQRVRAARGYLNLSLTTFAKQVKMGRTTLLHVEAGTRDPKDDELRRMAEVSGLPVAFFVIDDLHEALGSERPVPDAAVRLDQLEAEVEAAREETARLAAIVVETASAEAQAAIEAAMRAAGVATARTPPGEAGTDRPGEAAGGGGR